MNEYAHALFGALPTVAWVGLLAAAIIGAVLPWVAERAAPGHWDDGLVRLGLYAVAILAGPPAAYSFWETAPALTLGFVGGLAGQGLREWAATRWTWLSPRLKAAKEAADGSKGYHVEGIPETVWTRPPKDSTVQKDKT